MLKINHEKLNSCGLTRADNAVQQHSGCAGLCEGA